VRRQRFSHARRAAYGVTETLKRASKLALRSSAASTSNALIVVAQVCVTGRGSTDMPGRIGWHFGMAHAAHRGLSVSVTHNNSAVSIIGRDSIHASRSDSSQPNADSVKRRGAGNFPAAQRRKIVFLDSPVRSDASTDRTILVFFVTAGTVSSSVPI
jgi:hypothetical protein